jgi:hypothetical protein
MKWGDTTREDRSSCEGEGVFQCSEPAEVVEKSEGRSSNNVPWAKHVENAWVRSDNRAYKHVR